MALGMAVDFQYPQVLTHTKTPRTRHRTTVRCPRQRTLLIPNKAASMPAQLALSFLMVAGIPKRNWSSGGERGIPALILATLSAQQPVD